MYACICRAVDRATVAAVIATGARTASEIGRRCGAGTDCGTCVPRLERLAAASGGVGVALPSGRRTAAA